MRRHRIRAVGCAQPERRRQSLVDDEEERHCGDQPGNQWIEVEQPAQAYVEQAARHAHCVGRRRGRGLHLLFGQLHAQPIRHLLDTDLVR